MKAIRDIESKINKLSPALIGELDRYLDYLINKRKIKSFFGIFEKAILYCKTQMRR